MAVGTCSSGECERWRDALLRLARFADDPKNRDMTFSEAVAEMTRIARAALAAEG